MSAHWHGEAEQMTAEDFEAHLIEDHLIDAGVAGADLEASGRWHTREHGGQRPVRVVRPWETA